jgi:beta-lactam-binding protein with PASTA domain
VLFFFYVYLPLTTHHGQMVTVPNLVGIPQAELDKYLESRDLEYLVEDSTFNPDKPALTVLSQYPAAGQKVKVGRKIFVTLNSRQPPLVRMPNLVNRSVTNAEGELESYGLKKGEITYVPDLQFNAVLKQLYQGHEIKEGAMLPKGSRINLLVGNGLGNQEFEAPNLVGSAYDEAGFTLSGMDLKVGTVIYETTPGRPDGTVLRQRPEAGAKIRVGEQIDIWVSGPDPAAGADEPDAATEEVE